MHPFTPSFSSALLAIGLGSSPVLAERPPQEAIGAFDREVAVPVGMHRAMFLSDGSVVVLENGVSAEHGLTLPPTDPAPPSMAETPWCSLIRSEGATAGASELRVVVENASGRPYSVGIPTQGLDPLQGVVRVLPRDATPHEGGFLFLERDAHRVRAINLDGTERFRIGGKGRAPGQFNYPADMALDSQGRLFVVDTDNHRIQRFGPDGAFQLEWGARGAFPGLLAAPTSIDIEQDRIYVTEELNHRVSVYDTEGRYLYQWGMHAVVPRQGEGRIHYPQSVDVSADGTRAVVAEPFERRVQFFTLYPGGLEEARQKTLPSKQDIRSHFGPYIAGSDDLLAMWEPESGAIAVFDLTTETGINITVFTNHGSGWDDLGRLGALHLDADRQELIVSDVVNDRLQLWRLDRDRSEAIKYDPFMARLTSAVGLDTVRERLQVLDPTRTWAVPRIVAFARADVPEAPLLAADEANGVVLALDDRFIPVAVGAGCRAPVELVADGAEVRLLDRDDEGRLLLHPLDPRGAAMGAARALDFSEPSQGAALLDGVLYVGNQASDRIEVFARPLDSASTAKPLRATRQWGETGELDGQFYAPAGVLALDDERIVVVDQGNHRAQIFAPDGSWLSTFSLSSGYTVPRPPPTPTEDSVEQKGAQP